MMTFRIGEKVVYPNQGVGTIENISTRSFGSAFEKFYLLRFGGNSMTVLVPFSNAANIGLRRVTRDREISRILSYLSNGTCERSRGRGGSDSSGGSRTRRAARSSPRTR